MITYSNTQKAHSMEFEFKGLSSDVKPTGALNDVAIKNGSTFYEINTGDLYMYDAENAVWYKQ